MFTSSRMRIKLISMGLFIVVMNDAFCQIRSDKGQKGGEQGRPRSAVTKDTCTTPSSKSGSCIPLIRCRRILGRNMPDLTNSSCGEETIPRVCCPLADDDETTKEGRTSTKGLVSTTVMPTSTTRPTANSLSQVNSTDRGRRTGVRTFPDDCGQSGATLRRIVGGQDSILGAWPWMAAVYLIRRGVKSAECGGTLITSSHVLTAAHCTVTSRRGHTFNPKQLLVRLGDLNLESDNDGANPIDVKVRTIIKHEKFSLRTFQNDISILELEQSVNLNDNISPICLPFNTFMDEDLSDRNAIAAGWGSIRFDGPGNPHLQEVQLRIWRNSLCKEVFRRDVPITNANLCAGDGDKDACRGDSGGPLMLADSSGRFYLIGIVSFGRKCAEPGIPGVYARVTTYIDWIEQKIG